MSLIRRGLCFGYGHDILDLSWQFIHPERWRGHNVVATCTPSKLVSGLKCPPLGKLEQRGEMQNFLVERLAVIETYV